MFIFFFSSAACDLVNMWQEECYLNSVAVPYLLCLPSCPAWMVTGCMFPCCLNLNQLWFFYEHCNYVLFSFFLVFPMCRGRIGLLVLLYWVLCYIASIKSLFIVSFGLGKKELMWWVKLREANMIAYSWEMEMSISTTVEQLVIKTEVLQLTVLMVSILSAQSWYELVTDTAVPLPYTCTFSIILRP